MSFNVYEDARRARVYAALDFPGTYYLAYRDLPVIVGRHVAGRRALDLGCGAGRSTRFLRELGFQAVGADISSEMIRIAREIDPSGDYRLVGDGDLRALGHDRFDLAMAVFTFDNIPTTTRKRATLEAMRDLLVAGGRIVLVVSSPAIYVNEWASFTTRPFPGNWQAKDGDVVRTIITDTVDDRPVDDVLCGDDCYRAIFSSAGVEAEAAYRPLGRDDDPCEWITETRLAPWTIYVLARPAASGRASTSA